MTIFVSGLENDVEDLHKSDPALFQRDIWYDTYLEPDDVTAPLVIELKKLGPFW